MLESKPHKGFTLVELLVGIVLLSMISTMIYSILNVGVRLTDRGERRLLEVSRERGLVSLLQRQIDSAWFDQEKGEVMVSVKDDTLQLITRTPLFNRSAGLVLVVYRYNSQDRTLYYLERKDFFNEEYMGSFLPDFSEMRPLLTTEKDIELVYDQAAGLVILSFGGRQYAFAPRCQNSEVLQ